LEGRLADDDLLGQAGALTHGLQSLLDQAAQAKSGSAYLQVTDRM
jgi:hypothetical protein